MSERVDARMMKALGKVWEREVASAFDNGPQLCQLPEKMTGRLVAAGLVERVEQSFRDGLGRFTIKGCILTHTGRLLYCASCEDESEPDTPS